MTRSQQVLAHMEHEIKGAVTQLRPAAEPGEFEPHPQPREDFAPPNHRLPGYVQHRADANQIGMLAAEAVIKEYEKSAKAVEAMGEQFKAAGERATLLIKQLAEGQEQVQRLAEHYRSEGKKVFEQIQDCAAMTERTQKAMQTMADDLHGTVAEAVDVVSG